MSDPNETISLADARPSGPIRRREALTATVTDVAVGLHTKQQGTPENPVAHLIGKLARMLIGGAVLIVAYRVFDAGLTIMLKAEELRTVDCVRVGLGLVLGLVAGYIVAPDRTMAGL